MICEISQTKTKRNGFNGSDLIEKINEVIEVVNKLERDISQIIAGLETLESLLVDDEE